MIGLFLQTPYSGGRKDSIGGFPVRAQTPSKKEFNERAHAGHGHGHGGHGTVKGLFRGLQLGWRERIHG